MKQVQVNIEINNDNGFDCKIDINNLAREDTNGFEELVAEDIEEMIEEFINRLANLMKEKHPDTTYNRIKITKE